MEGEFYTYPSDIWSIGMVVYEMATGRHPYPETSNPLELHECIRSSPSPTLDGVASLGPEIKDFVTHR